jgi:hypothetical protein
MDRRDPDRLLLNHLRLSLFPDHALETMNTIKTKCFQLPHLREGDFMNWHDILDGIGHLSWLALKISLFLNAIGAVWVVLLWLFNGLPPGFTLIDFLICVVGVTLAWFALIFGIAALGFSILGIRYLVANAKRWWTWFVS